MARGGYRPGAGSKKGQKKQKTLELEKQAEEYRIFLREKVFENKGAMIAAQIKKALTGDTISFKELNDRAFGRSPEKLEVDNKGEITIKIVKYGDTNTIRLHSPSVSSTDTQSIGPGSEESDLGGTPEKR